MPLLSKPSSEAKISIFYVTGGALILVWSGVWYFWQNHSGEEQGVWRFICYGCLLSGAVITIIGLLLGQIARAARQAEIPPAEITHAEAQIAHEAAGHPPAVVPAAAVGNAVAPGNPSAPTNPAAPLNPTAPITPASRPL